MKSALTATVGVLLCLSPVACETSGRRAEPTESPKRPPPNPSAAAPAAPLPSDPVARIEPVVPNGSGVTVLRGEAAIQAIRARQPSGSGTDSLSWADGKMTIKTDYPDGSSMSIISGGPNGTEIEFRPAPSAPRGPSGPPN